MYKQLNTQHKLFHKHNITLEYFTELAYKKIAERPQSKKLDSFSKRVWELLVDIKILNKESAHDGIIDSQMDIFYEITRIKARLYQDARPVLDELKRDKYTIGLFSDTPWQCPGRYMDELLEEMDILDYFDFRLYSGDIEKRKPDPYVFERLSVAAGYGKEDMIYIGDREVDIMGAHNFGIPSVLINRTGKTLDESCPPPTYEISDLRELLDILPLK